MYSEPLSLWLKLFPSDQLLVLRYDDLTDDPRSTMARVFRHIGAGTAALDEARRGPAGPGLCEKTLLQAVHV